MIDKNQHRENWLKLVKTDFLTWNGNGIFMLMKIDMIFMDDLKKLSINYHHIIILLTKPISPLH